MAVTVRFLRMMVAATGLQVWTPRTGGGWSLTMTAFLMVSQLVPQAIISWNEQDVEMAEGEHAMQRGGAL
jgi:hypothetical protein